MLTEEQIENAKKSNRKFNFQVINDILWLTYKGYEIRIEKSKHHNNNNLVITVHPDVESDYTHRLEVKQNEK